MANEFFTILTATGRSKLARAVVENTPLALTHMAVGSGNNDAYYTPGEDQTSLKQEVWRGPLNNLSISPENPNWIVAECVIPDNVGGFYIREMGLFDTAGTLIAVGRFPESYKPTLANGSNKQLYVRMILEVSNTASVTLLVDQSIALATHQYVDNKISSELQKLDWKESVRAATTSQITLSGLHTIDGIALLSGDRVLVKNQNSAKENGIYIASNSAWVRAADANTNSKVTPGLSVTVEEGSVNSDSIWQLVTNAPVTLGTTALIFEMAAGRTGIAAGIYSRVTVNPRGLVVAGINTGTADEYGLSPDISVPLAALPPPYIATPDNRLEITGTTASGKGGIVSVPAGVMLSLGQEVVSGLGRQRAFTTPAFTSQPLAPLSEYYLRAQVVAGALVFYVQRGTLTDTTPSSLKGTIDGEFGGGFASTPVDICVARILTGAPGTAPTVQRVINRGTLSWSATLNGNGTIYLPFDPFVKTGRLTAADVTPHATAVSGIQHGSGGWTGRTYWYAMPTGTNGWVPDFYTHSVWSAPWAVCLSTNNVVGDVTLATSSGMFEHIAGKSMWQSFLVEHKIGDTTGAYGDEHLLSMATKDLLHTDYENGLAISFSNCLNATLTWEILR